MNDNERACMIAQCHRELANIYDQIAEVEHPRIKAISLVDEVVKVMSDLRRLLTENAHETIFRTKKRFKDGNV